MKLKNSPGREAHYPEYSPPPSEAPDPMPPEQKYPKPVDYPDQSELEAALGAGDINRFFELLCAESNVVLIARYLQFRFPYLRYSDIRDVIQETMIRLLKKMRQPGFIPEEPLRMVYHVAYCAGVDTLRANGRVRKAQEIAAIDARATGKLSVSDTHTREEDELHTALWNAVIQLPERQRLIVGIYLDLYESFSQRELYDPLIEAVFKITGERLTRPAVRSALRAGLAKIQKELTRLGWPITQDASRRNKTCTGSTVRFLKANNRIRS